ncbi:hypothetical protein SAMN02787142_0732 [Burkholderia sp. WP9]|nr:hypothetical protein SAMN02787142_0732 [Burkholderia sp. WP9]
MEFATQVSLKRSEVSKCRAMAERPEQELRDRTNYWRKRSTKKWPVLMDEPKHPGINRLLDDSIWYGAPAKNDLNENQRSLMQIKDWNCILCIPNRKSL